MSTPAPTVREIVNFLLTQDTTAQASVPPAMDTVRVSGVGAFAAARAGTMSWLSPRAALKHGSGVPAFGGSLLVAPHGVDRGAAGHAIVTCSQPKLAFSDIVAAFFPELVVTRWPPLGSQVADDARVDPSAMLAPGVVIGSSVTIGADAEVGPNTVIANALVGARVRIGANCTIGLPGFGFDADASGRQVRFPHVGRVVIHEDVEIGSNTCIDRGSLGDTVIGPRARIDNLVHVAHNVEIGRDAMIIAHAMIGGSVTIGDRVWCAPAASIRNQLSIGEGAVIGMSAVVVRSVEPGETVIGNPARRLDRASTGTPR